MNRRKLKPQIRELARVNNTRSAIEIVWQWSMVAAIFFAVRYFDHPVAYVVGMILMATRQHAMFIALHDAVHGILFTKRWANEYLADMLVGIPINFTLRGNRAHHLAHHRHVGSDKDPDTLGNSELPDIARLPLLARVWAYSIYILKRGFMYNASGSLLALVFPSLDPGAKYSGRERVGLLAWIAFLAALVTFAGVWFDVFMLWILPHYTILPLFLLVRGRPEHDAPYTEEVRVSRFVDANLLERFFICPLRINYHTQHHLYPNVPNFNLPKLQKLLMEDPVYREGAVITPGYWAWFKESMARTKSQRAGAEATTHTVAAHPASDTL